MSDAQAPSRVPGAESSLEQMMRDANRAIHFANDGRPAAVPAHWQPGPQSVYSGPRFPVNNAGASPSPSMISPPAGGNLYQPSPQFHQAGQTAFPQFNSPAPQSMQGRQPFAPLPFQQLQQQQYTPVPSQFIPATQHQQQQPLVTAADIDALLREQSQQEIIDVEMQPEGQQRGKRTVVAPVRAVVAPVRAYGNNCKEGTK